MSEGFGSLANSLIVTVIGLLLSCATTWFWFSRNAAIDKAKEIAAASEALKVRLSAAEAQLARINDVVVPINTMMQGLLIKQLTHYHTPEMDGLMRKLGPPNTLTEPEEARLLVLLEERTRDMGELISPEERGAAAILPVIMQRARVEQAALADAEAVGARLVSVVSLVSLPAVTASAALGAADGEALAKRADPNR